MRIERISKHVELMAIAQVISERSTCRRRAVGCVLVDQHYNIIATGRNGNPRGQAHCIDTPCEGAHFTSGTRLDDCNAVHAEMNALMQCADVEKIHMAICTTSPCSICTGMLLNTSCTEILYLEDYPHINAKEKWERAGRIWTKYKNML